MPEESKGLTRDAILGAQDLATEAVAVPEWGGTVYVRALSAGESLALQEAVAEKRGLAPVIEFVAAVAVDENGKRLFAAEDVEALEAKSVAALMRVFEAGAKLNAFARRDAEELEKN